jgi:hypothetical protein
MKMLKPLLFESNPHIFQTPSLRELLVEAVEFFNSTPVHPLPPPIFKGAGVYALYYTGNYSRYASLSVRNRDAFTTPIYIGKAMPPGSRQGVEEATEDHKKLYERIREHFRSIKSAHNYGVSSKSDDYIKTEEFRCRFMIIPAEFDGLIVPIESALIRYHQPLWNAVTDGFGNHGVGGGRYEGARPTWDTLHKGRAWADLCKGVAVAEDVIFANIEKHLARYKDK